jgi:hypothetical protein
MILGASFQNIISSIGWSSQFILAFNIGQLNFENQNGISGNLGGCSRCSIAQFWWDHQLPFFTNAHSEI